MLSCGRRGGGMLVGAAGSSAGMGAMARGGGNRMPKLALGRSMRRRGGETRRCRAQHIIPFDC